VTDAERASAALVVRAGLVEHGLEFDEARPGVFTATLPGERKLQTACSLRVGEHSLAISAFVARNPDENREAVYRWLLERNLRLYAVAFAVDHNGDIYLDGRIPLSAVTPDEIGQSWKDGKVHLKLRCEVNGKRLGDPNAGTDANFSLFDLVAHAAKTRSLKAGTLVGTGTISNADKSTGYACLMEARLVEQVEQGAAKTPFLHFGDTVRIEMKDAGGATVFGAIEQRVEKYQR